MLHDPACAIHFISNHPCDCRQPAQPASEPNPNPEIPPIVATVQAADQLIFLMPQLDNQQALRQWTEQLKTRYPNVDVSIVPAVGVVHIPAPLLQVVEIPEGLPGDTALCGRTLTEEGMKGFYLCELPARTRYPHMLHWSPRGNKTWIKSG